MAPCTKIWWWLPATMMTVVCRAWVPFSRCYRSTVQLSHASTLSSSSSSLSSPPQKVAVIGGGLAGLSTAYHLLELRRNGWSTDNKDQDSFQLTIFDKEEVGEGGASAVAGGLVHPLSPRGKLVHWGREGLDATNHLVERACQATASLSGYNNDNDSIVLRDEFFRIATSQQQAKQLQDTAQKLPDLCEWMDAAQMADRLGDNNINFGGLRLSNGCKVLHLPSYLKGLWAACQSLAEPPTTAVQWQLVHQHGGTLEELNDFDAVVWAAGSGLFDSDNSNTDVLASLPVQLVRGQSMEIRLDGASQPPNMEALLSGKYTSPLPGPNNRVLVGATHEFDAEPMSQQQVKQELQQRTELFAPHVWTDEAIAERYTTGTRVQSQRRSRGRLPIVGQLQQQTPTNHWIFTGLSSRGLLYHGVYAKLLAQAILEGSEHCLASVCFEYDWWRPK